MSKFEEYLLEASNADMDISREKGVTVSKVGSQRIHPTVSVTNTEGKVIMKDNLAFVKSWLKRNGITKVKYKDGLDKYDHSKAVKDEVNAGIDHKIKSGWYKAVGKEVPKKKD